MDQSKVVISGWLPFVSFGFVWGWGFVGMGPYLLSPFLPLSQMDNYYVCHSPQNFTVAFHCCCCCRWWQSRGLPSPALVLLLKTFTLKAILWIG